jgi:hypothetical protein
MLELVIWFLFVEFFGWRRLQNEKKERNKKNENKKNISSKKEKKSFPQIPTRGSSDKSRFLFPTFLEQN